MIMPLPRTLTLLLLAFGCSRAPADKSSTASSLVSPNEPGQQRLTPASGTRGSTPTPAAAHEGAATAPTAPASTTSAVEPTAEVTPAAPPPPVRTPDVIYVPTPVPVVDKMLELAKVGRSDVVYDLGCGDGRIVVTAAKRYGARAFGFDIDPKRVEEARANVKRNNVEDLVTIEQKDIFTLDLSPASVVTLYLLPSLNARLLPQLEKLKPGSRVVSHDYDIAGTIPAQHLTLKPSGEDRDHGVYFWTVPFRRQSEGLR